MSRLAVASILLAQFVLGLSVPSNTFVERAVAYYDPNANGGSMLDDAGSGGGEPLNVSLISLLSHLSLALNCSRVEYSRYFQVIISGLSSADVLTDDGMINYARAIGL